MTHSMKKIILYSSIVSISLILAYLLFSKSDNSKNNLRDKNSLSANYNYTSGREALSSEKNDSSLFDSENGFLEFSANQEEKTDKDSEIPYDPAKISPEERERRRKLAIEKFKPLVAIFPNNRYIPREKTEEELAKENRRNEIMNSMQDRILDGDELTSDESLYFYSEKKQELNEKLEILNYAKEKLYTNANTNSTTSDFLKRRFESLQSREVAYNKEIQIAKDKGADLKNFSEE